MKPADIRLEIIDILAVIVPDNDLSQLEDGAPFNEQLRLDSMDMLDIVMELRRRHRVIVPETDYVHLQSMQSTVAYLEPLLRDHVAA